MGYTDYSMNIWYNKIIIYDLTIEFDLLVSLKLLARNPLSNTAIVADLLKSHDLNADLLIYMV